PLVNGQVGVFLENKQEAVSLAQQRDRWISDVAHELKTPLTSIRLVAETLQSRVSPNLVSWVDRLLKEVIRLSTLVDDVLSMSRLEQHHTQVKDATETDIVQLIQAAWRGVEPLAKLKALGLDYQGPEQLVVTVNTSLMHSVLFNLLSNAVKYSPFGQMIFVKLSLVPKSDARFSVGKAADDMPTSDLLLEVIDAGTGFSEKDLPHVFDRFYRGDPARSRVENSQVENVSASEPLRDGVQSLSVAEVSSSGTGLGLAVVRQIVEAHEGRVEAKNYPETGGALLRVWLPGKRLV
ncbi:MAG: HAMP domain-containing sensor histidine kinase, partial [Cyanobacteria bacterium P01_C01_bin.69]